MQIPDTQMVTTEDKETAPHHRSAKPTIEPHRTTLTIPRPPAESPSNNEQPWYLIPTLANECQTLAYLIPEQETIEAEENSQKPVEEKDTLPHLTSPHLTQPTLYQPQTQTNNNHKQKRTNKDQTIKSNEKMHPQTYHDLPSLPRARSLNKHTNMLARRKGTDAGPDG